MPGWATSCARGCVSNDPCARRRRHRDVGGHPGLVLIGLLPESVEGDGVLGGDGALRPSYRPGARRWSLKGRAPASPRPRPERWKLYAPGDMAFRLVKAAPVALVDDAATLDDEQSIGAQAFLVLPHQGEAKSSNALSSTLAGLTGLFDQASVSHTARSTLRHGQG